MTFASPPIRFLLYPLHGEMRAHVRAEFFGKVLSQRVGRPVLVEISRTYEQVAQELAEGRVDMAWATAEQCDHFAPQARAVLRAVRSGRWYYSAAFVCRADTPLTLEGLRGLRAAWVDPLSTGGHLLPKRYLESRGLKPSELFSEEHFHGSYRAAMQAVLRREADVATIFTTHPDTHTVYAGLTERLGPDARLLYPFAFTEPCLADGLILTSHLSEWEASTLASAITAMSSDEGGIEPLLGLFSIEGFVPATSIHVQMPRLRPARRTEYLVADMDTEDRCQRLWSSTGMAFGRSVQEGEGSKLPELLPPEAGVPLEALVRAARGGFIGGRMELRMEVSGEMRVYAAEVTPRMLDSGSPAPNMALLVRDVTGQQALETELYRLASFPQLHPEPMLELEPEGAPRYANPAAHAAFPDLLWRGVSHPLVEAALDWAWHGAQGEGSPQVQVAGRCWELVVSHLQDIGVIRVFAKDVTSRKQLEASLLHADRMSALGKLSARVGHEMNNPLAFVMSNLSFAREEIHRLKAALTGAKERVNPQDIEEVIDALGEAQEGAERLKEIVQDLRLLAREPPRHRARVELQPVLEDTLKLVRNELRHRARLEKDFQPVPPVEADEAGLAQVFLNLMLNAVQAMSEHDAVRNVLRVTTRTSPDGEAIVEVRDTGAGMTPEVLSRLFEPFFTTRPNSVGMGLSVSHAIVTSLGGSLHAESQPGVGTRFVLVLPAA
ncbi:sensor histidine kinase [Hyalangium rubrum]|uniref:histidine kinase n=1 Tax=Hyalangium rubrum TaxID=3103134 RepID=A0ABU5HBH7_9BACT|nr:PhnD/SsuA/transferrin family substrate-binding protein [Hyalangium sp. s54d21]MDY7230822.1 PhnD/SsuA/transferrin family substrate-binding protein [Hyalangium sp. s54d21]